MFWTKEGIEKVLKEIQASIPHGLISQAVKESAFTPTILKVVDAALVSDSISADKKRRLQTLKDSGEFTKMKVTEDVSITKQIDNFVSRKIKAAIKSGLLPPRSKMKEFMPNKTQ